MKGANRLPGCSWTKYLLAFVEWTYKSVESMSVNGKQRIEAVLNGQWPDKRPVMVHNFMMAAREYGITMAEYRSDPQRISQAHIQAVEKYQLDGVFLDIDTATIAGALGVPVEYPADEPARCVSRHPLLEGIDRVSDLPEVNVADNPAVQVWVEACRLLKEYFGDEIFVRGNADQLPFSVCSMMRGVENWMMDLMDESSEPHVRALLEYAAEACKAFAGLMIDAGADLISHGDSPAGPDMISPAQYERVALPYEKSVIDYVHSRKIKHMLHICGNTNAILGLMAAAGTDAVELDYKTDIRLIHEKLSKTVVLSGTLDPSGVLYFGSVSDVRRAARDLLKLYKDSPRLIICSGCALPAGTPAENIQALVDVAREG